MGLNTSTLLNPSNRALTTAILSYHIIPSGAYTTANFTDGMAVSTLLPGAGELTVKVSSTDVTFTTPDQVSATVITRDIMAGRCVVHVIDNVLLPSLSTAVLLSQPDSGTVDETTEAGGGGAKGGHWEGVYVPWYVPPPPAPAGRDGINSPPAPSYISGSSQASTYVPSMTDIPSVSTLLTDRKSLSNTADEATEEGVGAKGAGDEPMYESTLYVPANRDGISSPEAPSYITNPSLVSRPCVKGMYVVSTCP
jgi:hypothetical protein